MGQGRENAKEFLRKNTDLFREIEKQLRLEYNLLDKDVVEKDGKEKEIKVDDAK